MRAAGVVKPQCKVAALGFTRTPGIDLLLEDGQAQDLANSCACVLCLDLSTLPGGVAKHHSGLCHGVRPAICSGCVVLHRRQSVQAPEPYFKTSLIAMLAACARRCLLSSEARAFSASAMLPNLISWYTVYATTSAITEAFEGDRTHSCSKMSTAVGLHISVAVLAHRTGQAK